MEIGEAVKAAIKAMKRKGDPECDGEDEDKGWQARVNVHGVLPKCTGKRLYDNLKAAADKGKGLGVVPAKEKGKQWTLAEVSATHFPVQAHHLIPKSYLPKHRVCVWLAKNFSANDMYQLRYDSNYDADHWRNGYCMPYATPLKEWRRNANKLEIAINVMKQTGIQLHQGSHARVLDAQQLEAIAGEPITPQVEELALDPSSDEYEEASSHQPGYLNRVALLLNVVDAKAARHARRCTACKAKKRGGKTLALPSEGVTRLMNQVSAIMKSLIDADVTHVSGLAYYRAWTMKSLRVVKGRIVLSKRPRF